MSQLHRGDWRVSLGPAVAPLCSARKQDADDVAELLSRGHRHLTCTACLRTENPKFVMLRLLLQRLFASTSCFGVLEGGICAGRLQDPQNPQPKRDRVVSLSL